MDAMLKCLPEVARVVIPAAQARITASTNDDEVMIIIHEEIMNWYEYAMRFNEKYQQFSKEERLEFASLVLSFFGK